MKNSLEALFGSKERWRIIKIFLLNSEAAFFVNEVAKKTQVNNKEVRQILKQLASISFITERKRKGRLSYSLNTKFPLVSELRSLVIKSNTYPQCEGLNKIDNLGSIKLAIVTGIFIDEPRSRTDLLIVGDGISQAKIKNLIAGLEAELGREVNYSIMESTEFRYRVNMFDKFIMEIMELPHQILINRIQSVMQQLSTAQKR